MTSSRECQRETTRFGTARSARFGWRREVRRRLLNLLFPPVCAACNQALASRRQESEIDDVLLCDDCHAKYVADIADFCPRCGAVGHANGGDCFDCQKTKFKFDHVIPLGVYREELRQAVIRMKLSREHALTWAVGGLLATRVAERVELLDEPYDFVTAIPKYWSRRLWTGVNSAQRLMDAIATGMNIPSVPGVLVCTRKTKKQSLLVLSDRPKNVRGAFEVAAGYDLSNTCVLLVDDIMTTGATANEAARVLRAAGVRQVDVAVVGRAP